MSKSPQETLDLEMIRGSAFSFGASFFTIIIGLIRSILLARYLFPEDFGLVALALIYIQLAMQLKGFGLDLAFIHQQKTDEDFFNTFITLRIIIDASILGLLLFLGPLLEAFYPSYDGLQEVTLVLAIANFISSASHIQESFLRRRLGFKQLAIIDVISSIVMTLTAAGMLWGGYGIWALVVGEILVGYCTRFILSWTFFRQWTPKFTLKKDVIRSFWEYGRPTWLAVNFIYILDRFDDFWIGTFLGDSALGLYTKSYEYARYPRRIFANPVTKVFFPIFARMQDQPEDLSRAFSKVIYLLTRISLLGAGVMVLGIPEFVQYVIGEQWTPLILTFRLMVIYAAFDPILILSQDLLLAIGYPRQVRATRTWQTIIFIPAVILGAWLWGINGVALAADLMLGIGLVLFYRQLKSHISLPIHSLISFPLVRFVIFLSLAFWVEIAFSLTDLANLSLKLIVFTVGFIGVSLFFELPAYRQGFTYLRSIVRAPTKAA